MVRQLGKGARGLVGVCLAAVASILSQPAHAYDPLFRSDFETVRTYYVSDSDGADSNPGTSLAAPWRSINRAVNQNNGAPAGSVVYVAPGTYHEQVVFARDNISLIGYHLTPGDQPTILANVPVDTDQVGSANDPFPAFDPTQMPLLDGNDRNAVNTGLMLRNRRGLIIKNFNIRNYTYGVLSGFAPPGGSPPGTAVSTFESHLLDNVNLRDVGATNVSYRGVGLGIGMMSTQFGNDNWIRNSLIIDASTEGLSLNGDGNVADNIHVYNTTIALPAATDYYVFVTGSRNLVKNSFIWRRPGTKHWGHGFSVKDNAELIKQGFTRIPAMYNRFENNVAMNVTEGFCVRHRGVQHNTFIDNTAYGSCTYAGDDNGATCDTGNGITIRDGAKYNTFTNTSMFNTHEAIGFEYSTEDDPAGHNCSAQPALCQQDLAAYPLLSVGNVIDNAQSDNTYTAIQFQRDTNGPLWDAGENTIRNSSFLRSRYIFSMSRPADDITLQDVHFGGVSDLPVNDEGFYNDTSYGPMQPTAQSSDNTCTKISGSIPAWCGSP